MTQYETFNHCPVCGTNGARMWGNVNGFPMRRCRSCGHLYVASAISEEMLAKAYEKDYYSPGTGSNAKTGYDDYLLNSTKRLEGFNRRLQDLERHTAPPGRTLDYGCAIGLCVKAAQNRGWDAIGYDRSEWATNFGRGALGINIVSGAVPAFGPAKFDLVTLWDCIEHLTDPRGTLVNIHSWLKPGGILAVNTVNSSSLGARLAGRSWRHVAPPLHIHLFSAKSLQVLIKDCGFSVVERGCEGIVFNAKKPRQSSSSNLSRVDDLLCHWRLRGIATMLNLRDEVAIVARRSEPKSET